MKSLLVGALFGALAPLLLRHRQRALELRRAAAGRVQAAPSEPDLSELTKEELYKRAQAAGIRGRSEMTKDELIAALRKHS
jgi:Rho termination factor-like protein